MEPIQPSVQRCPACGQVPMSRMQFLVIPGLESKCRKCGAAIRIRLGNRATLSIVGGAIFVGAAIVLLADTAWRVAAGFAVAVLLGVAVDQWVWRTRAWVLADDAARPDRDAVEEDEPVLR